MPVFMRAMPALALLMLAPFAAAQARSSEDLLRLTLSSKLASTPAPAENAAAAAPQLATLDGTSTELQLLPLEVTINGGPAGNWVLFERNGTLYALDEAFTDWRVNRRPNAVPVIYKGQAWYALSAVPGFEALRNFKEQSVAVKISVQQTDRKSVV